VTARDPECADAMAAAIVRWHAWREHAAETRERARYRRAAARRRKKAAA
jgi:hypothetical protein